MSRPLSLKEITGFFVPLALTSNLMMISHSIIHSAMARWDDATVSLAAYNVVFTFHMVLASPTVIASSTMLAFLHDSRALRGLLRFHGLIMVAPILAMVLVAATPLGDWVFGVLLGASPAVTAQARQAAWVFVVLHPFIALRSVGHTLFMLHRRTIAITLGTAIRLGSLAVFVFGVAHLIGGAVAGAISLVGAIGVEMVVMLILARRYLRELPRVATGSASQREMWGFAWPLMISQVTEGSLAFVINAFIGRLAQPDLALAAFGVVRGLAMLLLSPLRNLSQTAQALARGPLEERVMLRFTWIVIGVTTALIALMFWTPLRPLILDSVMGMDARLSLYSAPGVRALLIVPFFWGFAAVLRGMVAARKETRSIGLSSAFKMAAVFAAGGATLFLPAANGTVVGVSALAAAFGAESALLGWRYWRTARREAAAPTAPGLAPAETASASRG